MTPAKAAREDSDGGPARVLIVDDHPAIQQGLTAALDGAEEFEPCGVADTVATARDAIRDAEPDAVIVDLSLGDESGLELIKDLAKRHPDLPILVFSVHDESVYAERALRAGARGYVMKDQPLERVLEGLRQVVAGQVYLSHEMSGELLQRLISGQPPCEAGPVADLTDRELEIFELLGRGRTPPEIAATLHLSTKTVYTHCEKVKSKLGVLTATALRQKAFAWMREETGGA